MATNFPTLKDLLKKDLRDKFVLLRVDLNVPMANGKVADLTRISRVVPTIKALTDVQAKVIVLTHFGRPDGKFNHEMSLGPIADALGDALGGVEVLFGVDCVGNAAKTARDRMESGDVLLLENLRFHAQEEDNDPAFAKELASLGDYFVNDAFSCSHRAHASIVGIAAYLPAYAGFLMSAELEALQSALETPERPVMAMVGGSKVSTKIDLLENLVSKVDYLAVGGGMANTFLYAMGKNVGKSLCEKDYKETALRIIEAAKKHNCQLLLPVDGTVSDKLAVSPSCRIVSVDAIPEDKMMLDVGPETVIQWSEILKNCKTLVWNGPVGAYEFTPFDVGSIALARTISSLTQAGKLQSIAGGGDVLAALSRAGLRGTLTYISTAGGAFLEWLEGKDLPGVAILHEQMKKKVA
jgi:phosphoglycerate kinase